MPQKQRKRRKDVDEAPTFTAGELREIRARQHTHTSQLHGFGEAYRLTRWARLALGFSPREA